MTLKEANGTYNLKCDGCGKVMLLEPVPDIAIYIAKHQYEWKSNETPDGYQDFCPDCQHNKKSASAGTDTDASRE